MSEIKIQNRGECTHCSGSGGFLAVPRDLHYTVPTLFTCHNCKEGWFKKGGAARWDKDKHGEDWIPDCERKPSKGLEVRSRGLSDAHVLPSIHQRDDSDGEV